MVMMMKMMIFMATLIDAVPHPTNDLPTPHPPHNNDGGGNGDGGGDGGDDGGGGGTPSDPERRTPSESHGNRLNP
jgi:hypothetical protein